MIAATILAIMILLGGGGLFGQLMSQYVEDPMEDTILEEQRRELALDQLDELQDTIEDFNKQVSEDIERLDELVNDYDSKPEDFDQIFSSVFERSKQKIETLWDRRSAMLKHVEADEWQTIIRSAKAKMEEDSK